MQIATRIRHDKLTGHKAFLASLVGAAATAVCAQISFHLPDNPVPITMQTFAVLSCGLLLGSRYGALSQLEYLAAGFFGAPVFADFKPASVAFAGPTAGYLVGFVAAAYVVGLFMEMVSQRTFSTACAAGLLGVAVTYIFGAGWLAVQAGWGSWVMGIAPFVGVDLVKAVFAATLWTPRRFE